MSRTPLFDTSHPSTLASLNLINVLTYYLLLAFAVSVVLRLRNYHAILGLVVAFPNRWPKLLELVKGHRILFIRWTTLLPIGLTLILMLANSLASRLVWSQAVVTPNDLWGRWWALFPVIVLGIAMLYLDFQALFKFGRFDRSALEETLDKAEHWMQSWKAPTIRALTFGFINPRKIVNERVRESLEKASRIVNGQMWRWCLQIGTRSGFGLSLWMTWVFNA